MEPNQVGKLEIPVEFQVDKAKLQGQFKRDVEEQARQVGRRQAEVQASEFVKGLEQQYQRRLGEAREELVRGLISPKEFEKRGREAAQAMNKGILDELERRGQAGRLGTAYTSDFNTLAGAFRDVGTESKRGVRGIGEMRESFASLLAQAAGVHPVLGRIVNVMGGLAMGSVVMGGVLAGLSALAWWWNKVREEARDAKEEQERGLELLKQIQREQDLGPRGETGAAIEGQRSRQQEILRQQEELRKAWKEGTSLSDPTARIAILQEEYDKLERYIVTAEENLLKAALEAAPEPPGPGLGDKRKADAKATEEAKKAREKAQQEAEKAAGRLAALEADVQKQLTSLTATATDDLLLALDRLEAEGRAAAAAAGTEVSQAFLDGMAALREGVAATGRLEGLQGMLGDALRLDDMDAQQAALADLIVRLRAEIAALKEGSRARKEYVDLLDRAEAALKKNAEAIQKETEATKRESAAEARRRRQEDLQDLRERARLIEENARAALQLANALGIVSDEMMSVLENLAQLGGSVFRIASGDLTAIPSAIGAIAQLAKSAFGGKDAEALAQQLAENARQVRENTQALKDFREAALSGVTGEERAALVDFGKRVFDAMPKVLFGEVAKRDPLGAMDVLAAKMGVSVSELAGFFEDLERITGAEFFDAKKGVTNLDEFGRAWNEFLEKGIGGFDETVGGAIDALRFKWAILGDAAGTAADRVAELIAVLKKTPESAGFADALAAALASGGAEAANALLDDLAKRLAGGDQSLFGEGGIFAGLNAEEVRRLLEEGNALLEDMLGGAGGGTTQDFVQARSITEVTASRIEGALYTENVLSAERNALLRQLVGMQMSPSMAAGFVPGGASASDFTPAGTRGGPVSLHVDNLIGEVHASGADGESIIEDVRRQVDPMLAQAKAGLAADINRELGRAYRDRRRTLGRN